MNDDKSSVRTTAFTHSGRLKRYVALGAASVTTGVVSSGADAAIIQSDPAWSASISTTSGLGSGVGTWSITSFGPGGTPLSAAGIRLQIQQAKTAFGLGDSYRAWKVGNVRGFQPTPGADLRLGSNVAISGPLLTAFPLSQPGIAGSSQTYAGSIGWTQTSHWNMAGDNAASKRGYLGFAFNNAGNWHYGYFDIEVQRTGRQAGTFASLILHGWAYNSTPNSGLNTPMSVPGHTGLTALALGGIGLRGRRRARN